MIICVTGHRPDKLYGYDLTDPRWQDLKNIFKEKLIEMKCTNAISGMALGVDTIFALAVLELKKEGHPIQLHCALPCPEQCKKMESCGYCKISGNSYGSENSKSCSRSL